MKGQLIVKSEAKKIDGAAPSAYGSGGLAGRANTLRAQKDVSASNPGPHNLPLKQQNPNSNLPPATDHGTVPPIWYSFALVHRRMQEGGWTHQVTERELPSSKQIAAVQMRITAGSYRELHWHIADEWAYMLSEKARVTVLNPNEDLHVGGSRGSIGRTLKPLLRITLQERSHFAIPLSLNRVAAKKSHRLRGIGILCAGRKVTELHRRLRETDCLTRLPSLRPENQGYVIYSKSGEPRRAAASLRGKR